MPAISVLLDGELLAVVNTTGYDVVSVHVHGTRVEEDFAAIEMSGGAYPENAESTHLIWINSHGVRPGQQVEVRFQESGETLRPGKTIHELFPEQSDTNEETDFTPTEAMFAELKARPPLRDGFSFQLRGSNGTAFAGRTAPADHGFGFSFAWNSYRPSRVSESLHSYTLEALEHRTPMSDFVRQYIEAPYAVTLRVDV
jgi:hypothetical protein